MIAELRENEFKSRISRVYLAKRQMLESASAPKLQNSKRKVVYVMTHVSICGGVKVIFEHANRLREQGWAVCIVSHFPQPEWYPISVEYRQVPFGIELAQSIPLCDVIVATYWDHIQACIETGIAPVIYFEQGDEHLFHLERLSAEVQSFVKSQMELPEFIMTVSNQAALLLKEKFGRKSVVIPNAIDNTVFHEKKDIKKSTTDVRYILMMGNEMIRFKGLELIVSAVRKVKEVCPDIKLYWINPRHPSENWESVVDRFFVNPSQEKIAELFRNATIFVSASEFETFSLPVLEAMATACPVISTKNVGVLEYGIEDENIVFTKIGDEDSLFQKIMLVLNNSELRVKISNNGLVTAQKYNWQNSIMQLSNYLKFVSNHTVIPYQKIEDWDIKVDASKFLSPEEFQRFTKSLQHVAEDIIYIPVLYNWIENHPIARWEVAATRRNTGSNKEIRLLTPYIGSTEIDVRQFMFGEGIQYILDERYIEALDYFVSYYSHVSDAWKPSCTKWIVLCLIELNRDSDAINVIRDVLQVNNKFSDIYYLYYVLLSLNDNFEIATQIAQIINLIGDNVEEDEFFFNIKEKLNK